MAQSSGGGALQRLGPRSSVRWEQEALALQQQQQQRQQDVDAVDTKIDKVQLFVHEMLKRRDVIRGSDGSSNKNYTYSRKRKAETGSEITALSPAITRDLRHRLLRSLSASSSSSSGTDYSSDYCTSPESNCSLDSTYREEPDDERFQGKPPVIDLDFWPECVPHLSKISPVILDEISVPLSGWNPTTMTVTPSRPETLQSPSARDLLQLYLKETAAMLTEASPTYIALYRRYMPAMAEESPGLMEALIALAALQKGLQLRDERLIKIEAATHYHWALRHHYAAVGIPQEIQKDSLLATSIILAHYEIWNGENIKMGVHMLGGRDIIVARGKSAYMTPVGRALYAAFKRMDIATSWITGNPTFMTHDWWLVDPYVRMPIADDAPVVLVSDAAQSKLSVLCCKLTYLKAWAMKRRREQFVATNGSPSAEEKQHLQSRIERRVAKLEEDLEAWRDELPNWFEGLPTEPTSGPNGTEEDINTTGIIEILPRKYPHSSVALVNAWAIGVAVQLYRIRYPDVPAVPPRIGSLCHALLRLFKFMPTSTDGAMVAPLFAVGMELRQRMHQEWLTAELQRRGDERNFHGIIYLREGLRFAWAKFEGASSGRFNRIKEGAADKIEGVSENLWAAEGMLGTFEKLSLYDSPDVAGKRKNFKGDVDMEHLDTDASLEEALAAREREAAAGPSGPKRQKSGSPVVIVIDDDNG